MSILVKYLSTFVYESVVKITEVKILLLKALFFLGPMIDIDIETSPRFKHFTNINSKKTINK